MKPKGKKLTFQDGFDQGYQSQHNSAVRPTPRKLLKPYVRTVFQKGYFAGQRKAWNEFVNKSRGVKK